MQNSFLLYMIPKLPSYLEQIARSCMLGIDDVNEICRTYDCEECSRLPETIIELSVLIE